MQKCPHFRGGGVSLYTMSIFQYFRGLEFHYIHLYTEMSIFQGVGIEEFHCIQRCL